jgi:hypothetical protein
MKTFGEYVTSEPWPARRNRRASEQSSSNEAAATSATMAGLYASAVHVARIALAVFLFFLALISVLAGFSLLAGENDDLTDTGERVVGAVWLVSAALFSGAGALLLRRPLSRRTLVALVAVLVLGGVILTLNPYFGAPIVAIAVLVAVLGYS